MTTADALTSEMVDVMTIIRSWSQNAPGIALAEVDTINMVIGDGHQVLEAGYVGALRVDFNAYITGAYIHEFDGTTGSVVVGIEQALYTTGGVPTFVPIIGTGSPLQIASARYGENTLLTGWTLDINRGEVLRFSLTSVSLFTRLLIALRVRRLEP